MAVRHRDDVLAHLKELGLRLNVRKVCYFSTENHLSGRGGDPTTMQARMSPALIESIRNASDGCISHRLGSDHE